MNAPISVISAGILTFGIAFGACGGNRKPAPSPSADFALAAASGVRTTAQPTAVTFASAETTASPKLDGNAIINSKCTVCHTRARINRKKAANTDRAAWEKILAQMIENGAKINEAEREAILDYVAP